MAGWKRVLDDADLKTAQLIVQLQMQDAAAIASQAGPQQPQSDAAVARKIFEDDLKAVQGLFPDRALSENITVKENDHQATLEAAAFNFKFDEYRNKVDNVPAPPPPKPVTCIACTEQVPPNNIVKAPCSHNYCRDCLTHLFRSSMKDETLYPPRCCKRPIPVGDARRILPKDLTTEFTNRIEEFETKDKTYCHRPTCSAFIRAYIINGNLARCPRCRESTCADCKNQWHFGDCRRDEGMEQLLATADQNHWKRCTECRRFVELGQGCNHITCRCGHHFCYVCNEQWKTCRCPTWHEARLLARGQRIAPNFLPPVQPPPVGQNQRGNQPAPAPVAVVVPDQAQVQLQQAQVQQQQAPFRQQQAQVQQHQAQIQQQQQQQARAVQAAIEHVRNNHDCRHDDINNFRTQYAPPGQQLQCEICEKHYYGWLKQCKQCFTLICVRCKHNRLRA